MSTKIYHAYVIPNVVGKTEDLLWAGNSIRSVATDSMNAIRQKLFIADAIEAFDRHTLGHTQIEFGRTPFEVAYEIWKKGIEESRKGYRNVNDTDFSWVFYVHKTGMYVQFFTQQTECIDAVVKALSLEEFEYSDQTDSLPISSEGRETVWREIFHDWKLTPSQAGFSQQLSTHAIRPSREKDDIEPYLDECSDIVDRSMEYGKNLFGWRKYVEKLKEKGMPTDSMSLYFDYCDEIRNGTFDLKENVTHAFNVLVHDVTYEMLSSPFSK